MQLGRPPPAAHTELHHLTAHTLLHAPYMAPFNTAPSSPLGETVAGFFRFKRPLLIGTGITTSLLCATIAYPPNHRPLAVVLLLLLVALTAVLLYVLRLVNAFTSRLLDPCYQVQRLTASPNSAHPLWARVDPPPSVAGKPFDAVGGVNARAEWEVALTEGEHDRATHRLVAVFSDRLGNHVFQYCYARLRAAFLDLAFESPRLGGPFTSAAVSVGRWRAQSSDEPRHALLLRPRECCAAASPAVVYGPPSPCCGAATFLASPSWSSTWVSWVHAPATLYSMDTRMFAGSEGAIAGWLRPSLDAAAAAWRASGDAIDWQPRDVAIHLRVGDIIWGHHAAYRPLPMGFYAPVLRRLAERVGGAVAVSPSVDGCEGEKLTYPLTGTADGSGRRVDGEVIRGRRRKGRGSSRSPSRARTSDAVAAAAAASNSSNNAASRLSPLGRIVIVTEEPIHEVVVRTAAAIRGLVFDDDSSGQKGAISLCSGPVTIVSSSLSHDLACLYTAPTLVLSTSSFAWWPAFLSKEVRVAVVPRWGLLLPHVWRPSPTAQPDLILRHDLTIREVPEEAPGEEDPQARDSSSPPSSNSVEDADAASGGAGVRRGGGPPEGSFEEVKRGCGGGYPGDNSTDALTRLQAAMWTATLLPVGGGGRGGKGGSDSAARAQAAFVDGAPFPPAARVTEVELGWLGRWPGAMRPAIEALFK